ncbi:hypothetical protein M422DRAFT_139647, partial [Sphaerobolus stellatus SS14]
AKRSNHGNYSIQLDDFPFVIMDGFASPDMFNQPLFATTDLSYTNHSITIKNKDSGKL